MIDRNNSHSRRMLLLLLWISSFGYVTGFSLTGELPHQRSKVVALSAATSDSIKPTTTPSGTQNPASLLVQQLLEKLSGKKNPADQSPKISQLENLIDQAIAESKSDPRALIQQLEEIPSQKEPNRSPNFFGEWHVWYTDCPPPSNGKLGPFQGTASQIILDESTRSYQNVLKVPPNDWLTAVLDGVYEDWDGAVLDESGQKLSAQDWGACHWKVTFLQLQISFFGIPLFNKEFGPDTSRVWRTTFLRDDIRIVRAGKTGRLEDEVVFYTKRTLPPDGWVPS
mmetsp:Transcript_18440/g.23739  ORF Transcript_18440/g.23739 Transcript_18440/m.23739 type:complete len:282 (-) Transcript_18440:143-988(-)